MKQLLSFALLIGLATAVHSQDTAITFQKVLKFDSLTKNQIFDKSLIWCSKSFKDSKSAINVKEREGGIISGKADLTEYYKVPGKKDSTVGSVYLEYRFDWLIEVKDGKLRFSITNINYIWMDKEHPVTTSDVPPIPILFKSKEKTELEWKMSKMYFMIHLDMLMSSLNADILSKKDDF